ncbi:MAG: hypothetical protein NTU41_02010 [Chloroflexi bacterium]|nr:hypothetical protein [Chloroflexota bacterium]
MANYYDYRFAREYGYQKHIAEATKGLMKKLAKKPTDFAVAVFQQPDGRLAPLVAKDVGMKAPQLAPDITAALGDLGSCSAFVSLAGVLDKAQAGQRILLASYGSGQSSTFSIMVGSRIADKKSRVATLEKQIARKAYVDYPTYLRLNGNLVRSPY